MTTTRDLIQKSNDTAARWAVSMWRESRRGVGWCYFVSYDSLLPSGDTRTSKTLKKTYDKALAEKAANNAARKYAVPVQIIGYFE